jgi:hypothetical protein
MNSKDLEKILPPPAEALVYKTAIAGVAACFLAMVLGLIQDAGPGIVSTFRLLLVAGGCLAAGSALSMRPALPFAWCLAAIAFLLAYPGLPSHWDSARYVAIVGTGVCLGGTLLSACPATVRYWILTLLALVHYVGIFCATTWPDPAPWATHQIGTRIYLPYLKFMYLQNAYHFYSPEPGPASHIFALVKYDKIDPKTGKPEAQWITLPNRDEHMKDPLGLGYYRRLSITEQVSQSMPPMIVTFEANEITQRRQRADGLLGGIPNYPRIPLAPAEFEPVQAQYRPPRPDISRYLLPSYANHILRSETTPERKAVSVKIYRLEHRVTQPWALVLTETNPHHPTTFRPYYLGEFEMNAEGKIDFIDSQDPLLYWLVPILPKPPSPTDPEQKQYIDYMSIHAGYVYDWRMWKP